MNWLGKVRFVGSANVSTLPPEWTAGWSKDILKRSMWVKGVNSSNGYTGFRAFRRMAWVLPLLWPLLPLFYIPPVPQIGERIYAWIARNRHSLGCQSDVCQL